MGMQGVKEELAKTKAELAKDVEKIASLEALVAQLQAQHKGDLDKLHASQEQNMKLAQDIADMKAALGAKMAELEAAKKDYAALKTANDMMQDSLKEAQGAIQALTGELDRAKHMPELSAKKDEELKDLRDQLTKANADLSKAQYMLEDALKKIAEKDAMIADLQNELKALRDALARSKEDLAKANADLDKAQHVIDEAAKKAQY